MASYMFMETATGDASLKFRAVIIKQHVVPGLGEVLAARIPNSCCVRIPYPVWT